MAHDEIQNLVHDLKSKIIRLKRAKLEDEEEYSLGKITLSELRFRAEKHDEEIAKAQDEIDSLQAEHSSMTTSHKKIEIFISYSSKDVDKARLLTQSVETDHIAVWRDEDRLKAGAAFTVQLERAILRSDVVILIVSQSAKESKWVRNETLFAIDANKEIIPVMVEDGISLPFEVYAKQYIKLFTDWNAGIQRLKERLFEIGGEVVTTPPSTSTTFAPKVQKTDPVSLPDVNPFLFGSAVPDNLFFGRNSIITDIRNRIGSVQLQSLSIVANRRMGKTSLMNYIRKQHKSFLGSQHNWVFVYIDMMDARAHTTEDLMQLFRRGIAQQIGHEPWSEKDDGRLPVLSNTFEELADNDYRLVLCLDEWEKVMAYPELDKFIEALRSAGQLSWISMITATARTLLDLYQGGGLSSEFYNIFRTSYLGLMPQNEWVGILKDGFARSGLQVEQTEIDLTQKLAGGHPYLTQLAGSMLWDARRENWDEKEIYERYYAQAEMVFSQIWQRQKLEQNEAVRDVLGLQPCDTVSENTIRELKHRGVLNESGDVFCVPFEDYVKNAD